MSRPVDIGTKQSEKKDAKFVSDSRGRPVEKRVANAPNDSQELIPAGMGIRINIDGVHLPKSVKGRQFVIHLARSEARREARSCGHDPGVFDSGVSGLEDLYQVFRGMNGLKLIDKETAGARGHRRSF
jgi:hypothetical protein